MTVIQKKQLLRTAFLVLLLAFWYYVFNVTGKLWVQIVSGINIFLVLFVYIKSSYMKAKTS